MKLFKGCVWLLLLLLFVLSGFSGLADSIDNLPVDVQRYLTSKSLGDATILSYANGIETGGSDACYFVLLRTKEGINTLYVFKYKDTGWEFAYSTFSAVPQTQHDMGITLEYSGEEWPTLDDFNTPHFSILQIDADDEYPELCITFELSNGNWLLHRVWSYTDYDSMLITDDAISYYEDIESRGIIGTVYGAVQRDLRYFSISDLPKTLREAKNKIASAPEIPQGDFKAREVQFARGRKYDVYSAPNRNALRGANGKSSVSTNEWIQVFGQRDGWILIQYSIDSNHYRFGYIDAASLPENAEVSSLNFVETKAWTVRSLSVTDDPLYSQRELFALNADSPVTWLANMGQWAYIEYYDEVRLQSARGFMEIADLRLLSSEKTKEIAKQTLLTYLTAYNAQLQVSEFPEFHSTASFEPSSGLWSVRCSFEPENVFLVIVDDKTGSSWLSEIDHG